MAIHILGNGPSIRLFDRDAWPETDVFVGCNFSDESLRPDYTVIIDVRAMKQFRSGDKNTRRRLSIPAVISDRANKYIEVDTGGWHKIPEGYIDVVEVIPLIRDKSIAKRLAMNSGQHAVIHAVRNNPQESEVHIWGTDSLWSQDIGSTTDTIVRPKHKGPRIKPHITDVWSRYWLQIFSDYLSHRFIIHSPDNTDLVNSISAAPNVIKQEHQK